MSSSSVASSVPASGGSAIPTGTGSANLGDRSADPVASEAESSSAGKSAEGCLAVARSLHKGTCCFNVGNGGTGDRSFGGWWRCPFWWLGPGCYPASLPGPPAMIRSAGTQWASSHRDVWIRFQSAIVHFCSCKACGTVFLSEVYTLLVQGRKHYTPLMDT